ncbi:MAG: GAF domain-containing protein [Chloroflexi bacterium]|nr:GAF domain-containing protein [Chloroflexota bacterium]
MKHNGKHTSPPPWINLPPGERALVLIQALNAAASALLQSTYSEAEVFHLFSQQMMRLGLDGTLYLYDARQDTLSIQSFTFSPKIQARLKALESNLGFQVIGQAFPLSQVPPLAQVIFHKRPTFFAEAVFFHKTFVGEENAPLIRDAFGNRAVIAVPFLHEGEVLGLLTVSGTYLTEADVPLIAAFSNQIAVALMNARLIAAAKQTEQKYRRLFEQAPVMYLLTENRGGEPTIVECNRLLTEITGYSRLELIGGSLADLYTEPSKERLRQGGYQKALEGNFVAEERQLVTKDGRIIETILQALPDTDVYDNVIGTRAMFVDITAHKKADAQRQAYQEQLKVSLDEMNILVPASAIVTHATQNEEILHDIGEYLAAAFDGDGCALYSPHPTSNLLRPLINVKRIRSMGGVRTEGFNTPLVPSPAMRRALNKKAIVFLTQEDETLLPEDQNILERHEAKTVLLVPLIIRDEVMGLAELYTYRGRDYTQRELLFVQTLTNYLATGLENARLFEALRQANEELEQRVIQRTEELQNRNQELDAFAHTVAHDLQAILTRVIMFSEALLTNYDSSPPEEQKHYLRTIGKSGRKMQEVIESLFLLATLGKAEVNVTPLDMGTIIQDTLNRLEDEIQQTQASIQQPIEWPIVLGYRPWIEAVWVNYLSNALKYGGQPPHITLGTDPIDADTVRFWVKDKGPGLSLQNQVRLFDPFFQAPTGREKGHGLGLSIVKRIIDRLGGEVGVESEEGQGSCFYFTLPAAITQPGG